MNEEESGTDEWKNCGEKDRGIKGERSEERLRDKFAFLSGKSVFKGEFHQNFIIIIFSFFLEVAFHRDFKRLA